MDSLHKSLNDLKFKWDQWKNIFNGTTCADTQAAKVLYFAINPFFFFGQNMVISQEIE